jgi:hypothetical protein
LVNLTIPAGQQELKDFGGEVFDWHLLGVGVEDIGKRIGCDDV